MSRAEFKRRLAALAEQYAAPTEPVHIRLCVMCFVESDDPRLGSCQLVEQSKSSAAAIDTVEFFCLNLEHFNQMQGHYTAENENTILMGVNAPRADIQTTNVRGREDEDKSD